MVLPKPPTKAAGAKKKKGPGKNKKRNRRMAHGKGGKENR